MLMRRWVAVPVLALALVGVGVVPAATAAPTWNSVAIPKAPHGSDETTQDLACPAAGRCIAVGQFLASTSNGTVVSSVDPPVPAGGSAGALTAVSCWDVGSCVAVGSYVANFRTVGLIDSLRDGVWTPRKALDADGAAIDNGLDHVACNARMCVATADTLAAQVLVRTPHGGWQAQPVTSTTGFAIEPRQPECPPSGSCLISVDGRTPSADHRPMFAYPSGDEWHAVLFPVLPDSRPETLLLSAMTCPSSTRCLAFGSMQLTANQQYVPVVEKFASGELSAEQLPAPATAANLSRYAAGVDCSSATRCAGYLQDEDALILYRLDHGHWRFQKIAVNGLSPQEIGCSSTTCVITGYASNRPVIELDGATWSVVRPPYPRTSPVSDEGELTAVSCSATACALGGDAGNSRFGTSSAFVAFSG